MSDGLALVSALLEHFGHDLHSACALDVDTVRTNVYVAERDRAGTKTGRVLVHTYDTLSGVPCVAADDFGSTHG